MKKSAVKTNIITALIITVISIFLCEIAIRVLLFVNTPSCMIFDKDILYAYKPYCVAEGITMNNRGYIGDDMETTKNPGETRIMLLGESTSFNSEYVKAVKSRLSAYYTERDIKVTSCGRPRYTSYINRINFEKNLIGYKPDIIVLYMGINDNIYNTFYWVSALPDVGYFNWLDWKVSIVYKMFKYHLFEKKLFSRPQFRKEEIRSTQIFKENISAIISIAKANNIKVVLSTFAIALPSQDQWIVKRVQSEEKKMQHFWGTITSTIVGVEEHNKLMRELSKTNKLPIADNYALIPKSSEYFVDICHMTTLGANNLGANMATTIAQSDYIKK